MIWHQGSFIELFTANYKLIPRKQGSWCVLGSACKHAWNHHRCSLGHGGEYHAHFFMLAYLGQGEIANSLLRGWTSETHISHVQVKFALIRIADFLSKPIQNKFDAEKRERREFQYRWSNTGSCIDVWAPGVDIWWDCLESPASHLSCWCWTYVPIRVAVWNQVDVEVAMMNLQVLVNSVQKYLFLLLC